MRLFHLDTNQVYTYNLFAYIHSILRTTDSVTLYKIQSGTGMEIKFIKIIEEEGESIYRFCLGYRLIRKNYVINILVCGCLG